MEWSYQLLDEHERRVFRAVSVFPGPFTLEGAEAVAGTGAGLAVLRLVDCSLLVPPRAGADGRSRYVMLETLRAYGAQLRAEAGEQDTAAAALAGYALRVAEEAAAGLQTSTGEVAAARWLDAEDPTTRQVLAWAIAHDAALAVRLADALGWWWWLRGRLPGQYPLLGEVAGLAEPGSDGWCAIASAGWAGPRSSRPIWPGRWAISPRSATPWGTGGRPGCWPMPWPAGRSVLLNMGRLAEGAEDGRRVAGHGPGARLPGRRGRRP